MQNLVNLHCRPTIWTTCFTNIAQNCHQDVGSHCVVFKSISFLFVILYIPDHFCLSLWCAGRCAGGFVVHHHFHSTTSVNSGYTCYVCRYQKKRKERRWMEHVTLWQPRTFVRDMAMTPLLMYALSMKVTITTAEMNSYHLVSTTWWEPPVAIVLYCEVYEPHFYLQVV